MTTGHCSPALAKDLLLSALFPLSETVRVIESTSNPLASVVAASEKLHCLHPAPLSHGLGAMGRRAPPLTRKSWDRLKRSKPDLSPVDFLGCGHHTPA